MATASGAAERLGCGHCADRASTPSVIGIEGQGEETAVDRERVWRYARAHRALV